MSANPSPSNYPSVLRAIRPVMGIGLLILALVFALLIVYLLYSQGSLALGRPVFFALVIATVASLVHGLLIVINQDRHDDNALETFRIQVMTWGGILGATLAGLGLALPFTNEYATVFGGGLTNWRENSSALIWTSLSFITGLVVLFLSLNLARGTERSSGIMRRLLYGYNVVLSSLLLLMILLLVNVLGYVRLRPFDVMGRTIDLTSSGIYSIGEPTRAVLRSLTSPMHVTLIMDREDDQLTDEVERLLETCASYSSNFHRKTLDLHANRKDIVELRDKHKLNDPTGMLVVLTTESGEVFHHVERRELITSVGGGQQGGAGRFEFGGENALLNAMKFLLDGKAKPNIYFLQGHGMLELTENDASKPDVGIGLLSQALTKNGYEVHPLRLAGEKPKVPDNADIVVVPRPTTPIPQPELDALLEYARDPQRKPRGRLIVLGDVIVDGSNLRNTGVEALVGNFNVRLRNERILALDGPVGRGNVQDPLLLGVGPVRIQEDRQGIPNNPIAMAWLRRDTPDVFRFLDARPVEAGENNPNAPSKYIVVPLFFPWIEEELWTETDLAKGPLELAANYRTKRAEFLKVRKPVSIPVAVAVSEAGTGMPASPHAPPPTTPKMLVFGDATWISNYGTTIGKDHINLFGSCINWLREKPAAEKLVSNPERVEYVLNIRTPADFWSLALIPGSLLILLTIALGLGVWVVRRR